MAVSRPRRLLRCTGLALALFGTPQARIHPLHTTLTEVSVDPDGRTITLTIRGFADDLALGTSRNAGLAPGVIVGIRGDSLTARYLAASLLVQDRKGQRLPLTWSATRRAADVLWFSFRFSVPGGLAGVMVAMLFFWLIGYGFVIAAHINAALANPGDHPLKGHSVLEELAEAKWLDT